MRKVAIFILFWVLLLSSPLAAEQVSQQEYSVLTKAYQFLEKEQYRESLKLLQPLLGKRKPSSYAFSYGALCHVSLFEFDKAQSLLKRAVQLYPEQGGLWHNLGNCQMQLNAFAAAVNSYRTVIALDGDTVVRDIYYQLGFALYRLGRYREAIQAVAAIVDEEPKKHWLQLKAYCYLELKEWEKAETVALKIMALTPSAADIWTLLALIRIHQDDYPAAAAYLEVAGFLAPDRVQHATLSNLYGSRSAWNEQVRHLEQLKRNPYQVARRLKAASNYLQALERLGQQGEADMESALMQGTLLFATGRNSEAVVCLLKVARLPCTFRALSGQKTVSQQERRHYKDRLRARALLLAGQILWLDHQWLAARDVFKKLELLSGYEDVGKSLASCMQSLLLEKGGMIELPGLFDPPLAVESADG